MSKTAETQQADSSHDARTGQHAQTLMKVNVALVLVLIVVVSTLFVQHFGQTAQADGSSDASVNRPEYEESDFVVEQKSYDIYPGQEKVLYTNYACPYCADFWKKTNGEGYTVRILMLNKESQRFATQGTASSFMLALYRDDPGTFERMQQYLFENQDEWTPLSDSDVLALLNEKAGTSYTFDDLADELAECEQAKAEAPEDLQFVPALYSDGKRYDGYVLDLVGD